MTGEVATAVTELHAGAEQVWQALTEPRRIAVWMDGARVETTWQVGSPITWTGVHQGHEYQDRGQVLVVDAPNVLSMTHYSPFMGDDRPENYHTLRYSLESNDGTTRLTLTQDGCVDAEQAEQFSRNWQLMLDALSAHLDG